MRYISVILLTFISSLTFGQFYLFEPTSDSSLSKTEVYYIFIDTVSNITDSSLIVTSYYEYGLLKGSESKGHEDYTSIIEYKYYPETSNIFTSSNRWIYKGQDSTKNITYYKYDSKGNAYFVSHYDTASQENKIEFHHFLYDSLDRIKTEYSIRPMGVIGIGDSHTEWEYNDNGDVFRAIYKNGHLHNGITGEIYSVFEYNHNKQMTLNKTYSISYTYDNKNSILTQDTIPFGVTEYEYDKTDQLVKETFILDVSDQPLKEVGQTYQKNITEYYYHPNGLFSLQRKLNSSDSNGKEKIIEYTKHYDYIK